jgi:hypothetical protein
MGKKIFVSYKYADNIVQPLPNINNTTVRDYVDIFQSNIDNSDHINKGEDDGEDMGNLADSTIASKLGDKIFDSTVTIVFISKGMKENIPEKDQWIPWEISYSLKQQSRQGRNSKTNAILAVVLPDNLSSYNYYFEYNALCKSTTQKSNILFDILRLNMFNQKEPSTRDCNGNIIYTGLFSYIYCVKWNEFINHIDDYINIALEIWSNKEDYNIRKNV